MFVWLRRYAVDLVRQTYPLGGADPDRGPPFPPAWSVRCHVLFNKLTNDYGRSWSQALGVLFVFSALTFVVIKISLGYTFVLGSPKASDFSQYLEYTLNPLHQFAVVFGKEQDMSDQAVGLAKLVDILGRFGIGLLLFQLVRAFRKYVK